MSAPAGSQQSLHEEIEIAMAAVRATPQAIEPHMALFQLACIVGDWSRARNQLDTMASLDRETMLLSRIYGRLIEAETARARIFAGIEQPVAFGEPTAWLAMLAQALTLDCRGEPGQARDLRERARQAAMAKPGKIGNEDFAWVMDADPRLGPTLEIIVEGQYRWLPLEKLRELRSDPPRAMRDLVWQPATLDLLSGDELSVFIPVRYPGSELEDDDAVRMAKETRWTERNGEQWGVGQRMLATDVGDYAFLDVRRLRFTEEVAT